MSSNFQIGDLIGFSGSDWLSAGINLTTYGVPGWSLSHVGIVGEYRDEVVLFESTTLSELPCLVQGKVVSGAQVHPIEDRLAGYTGRVWHYPLYRSLYKHERLRLNEFLCSRVGTPYDAIGAFRSAGVGYSWIESWLQPADLSSLFCSEWCAAAHAATGIFANAHVSRWNPNRFVRAERRAGILRRRIRLSTDLTESKTCYANYLSKRRQSKALSAVRGLWSVTRSAERLASPTSQSA